MAVKENFIPAAPGGRPTHISIFFTFHFLICDFVVDLILEGEQSLAQLLPLYKYGDDDEDDDDFQAVSSTGSNSSLADFKPDDGDSEICADKSEEFLEDELVEFDRFKQDYFRYHGSDKNEIELEEIQKDSKTEGCEGADRMEGNDVSREGLCPPSPSLIDMDQSPPGLAMASGGHSKEQSISMCHPMPPAHSAGKNDANLGWRNSKDDSDEIDDCSSDVNKCRPGNAACRSNFPLVKGSPPQGKGNPETAVAVGSRAACGTVTKRSPTDALTKMESQSVAQSQESSTSWFSTPEVNMLSDYGSGALNMSHDPGGIPD